MRGLTGDLGRQLRTAAGLLGLGAASLCAPTLPVMAQDVSRIAPPIDGRPVHEQKTPRGPVFPRAPTIDRAQPLYLQGDELIYDNAGSRVTARGNVEIYYANYILTADEVIYDQGANQLSAQGNVILREPGGAVTTSESIVLSDDFRDGFVQSLSFTTADETRITARRATRREGNVTEFEDGKFTPCKAAPGTPPLWCIRAKRVVHDQSAQTITYKDAAFELYGVPVLYVPYFEHADPTVKRKSGFLAPNFSASGDLGYVAEVAYYWAMAPNYDLTLHPAYTTRQGVLWQADFRHRLARGSVSGQYRIDLAGIDQDVDNLPTENADDDLDGWRGSVHTTGDFSLASWWRFGWDVTLESDDSFRRFYKLDNILQTDRINQVHLVGLSDRNYLAVTGYHFGGLLLSDDDVSESQVHPVLDWNYVVGAPVLGGELSWNVNALSLTREQDFQDNSLANRSVDSVTHRASANIMWRRKLTDHIGITYTPFANLRGDLVSYRDTVNPLDDSLIKEQSAARGSASAGLLAAYPWIKHTFFASHTIEPIGQVIARTAAARDQNAFPNEDAKSLIFDDTNLFELDKHSGYDRIETGTRANIGLQYTFQRNTGGYARLLAGQSFLLAGPNNYAHPVGNVPTTDIEGVRYSSSTRDTGLATTRSDYVLAAYLAPAPGFRFVGQARFDETNFALRTSSIYAQANYGPFAAQVSYTYAPTLTYRYVDYSYDPPSTYHDLEDGYPTQEIYGNLWIQLTENWSAGGMLRFDIDDSRIRQDALSLRYADECYVLTLTYLDNQISDPVNGITPDQSIMVRFGFKHLGDFRYKTDLLAFDQNENQ